MALTVTGLEYGDRQVEKNVYNLMRPYRLDCDSSYVTGGYSLDLSARLGTTFPIKEVIINQYGGYHAEYDRATNRLLVTRGGTEVSAGTDLSSVYFIAQVWGYRGFDQPAMAPTAMIQAGAGIPGASAWVLTAFADGDVAPTVAAGLNFITSFTTANTAPTSITSLANIIAGQQVTIVIGDTNTTFVHGANLILDNGLNQGPMAVDDVLHFIGKSLGVARQVGISYR
jgi:hypothetical protein